METCYKVMRTDIARSLRLESDGFDIEPEITAKLLQVGPSDPRGSGPVRGARAIRRQSQMAGRLARRSAAPLSLREPPPSGHPTMIERTGNRRAPRVVASPSGWPPPRRSRHW